MKTNLDLRLPDKVISADMKIGFYFALTVCLGFTAISESQEKLPIKKKPPIQKMTTLPTKEEVPIRRLPMTPAVPPLARQSLKRDLLIGIETRNYRYSEPGFISHAGLLFGIWGEWNWASKLGNVKLYGNLLLGNLEYDGALCDLADNCTPYKSRTEDLITKINSRLEFNINNFLYFFAGAGFRYLYDRGQGVGFYTRSGRWVYLPVGAGLKQGKILFDLEYDYIVYGNFKSNLSEVSSAYNDLTHSQKGYGLLLTAGYQLNESWNLKAVYELWNLDESEWVASGEALFAEPKNNSESYGLKLGYLF